MFRALIRRSAFPRSTTCLAGRDGLADCAGATHPTGCLRSARRHHQTLRPRRARSSAPRSPLEIDGEAAVAAVTIPNRREYSRGGRGAVRGLERL
jgi:hypothetical protein